MDQFSFPKQKVKETIKQPLFQFRLDYYSGRFIREIKDPSRLNYNKNP